jgi:hypothetical protein
MEQHILTTGQIEDTLAYISDMEARIDLLTDSEEDIVRADAMIEKINEALDALGESIPAKAERAVYVLRAAESRRDLMKKHEAQLKARRAREEKTIERVRDVVARLLAAHKEHQSDPKAKLQTDAGTIYETSRTRVVGPDDISLWPAEFLRHRGPEPDKSKMDRELRNTPEDELPQGFTRVTKRSTSVR